MTFREHFFASLFQVRARRILVASAATLLVVLLLDPFLRYGWVSRLPVKYILRNEADDQAYATWLYAQASLLPQGTTPVYVIGGSGTREAIESAEALETLLKQAMPGKSFKVFPSSTSSHNFANDLSVLDLIRGRPGLIVYGIDPNRFVIDETSYKNQAKGVGAMGRNAAYIDFLREHKPGFLPDNQITLWLAANTYVIPAARLVAEKISRTGLKTKAYLTHHYSKRKEDGLLNEEIDKSYKNMVESNVGSPGELSAVLARHFFRMAQAQGHKIFLFEQPIDYAFINTRLDKQLALYDAGIKALAREENVHYTNFERELSLPSAVFADRAHIFDAGARKLFMNKLADEISAWIQETEKQP